MSPQMNGEPRETPSTTPALATSANRTSANRKPIATDDADRTLLPVLEAINTDGVTQTTITKDDTKLAALFTPDTATDFRSRWDVVQRGFVDDPREAVHAADQLVAQVIKSLAETFANQRSEIEGSRNDTDASTTENLRISLRRYRSFFERLLSI